MTAPPGTARPPGTGLAPPTLHVLPDAIERNVAIARARTGAQVMAVVKADGYGHGALRVASAALAAGATWLGTTSLDEAVALREAGLPAPVLTWLNPTGTDAEVAVAHRIDVALGSVDELKALVAQAPREPVRVHLHVDTGMAREGSPASEWLPLIELAREAQRAQRILVTGLMGHLPLADLAHPPANASAIARLRAAAALLRRARLAAPLVHLAATAATLTDPATHFDMVRFGAGLVGIDPSATTELHPASRLTAPVVHSTTVGPGTPVGYGGTYVTDRTTHLGVLPVGYADGIPRELSADAHVQVDGRRCPVVGRVCMDQLVIDTGATQVPHGTTATVFGPPDGVTPTVHDWARWAGTIPHTVVTAIGPRITRTAG